MPKGLGFSTSVCLRRFKCLKYLERIVLQDGAGTEPEPETGTVGAVFAGTETGTGTVGTVFLEPKPESEPCLPLKTAQKHRGISVRRGTIGTATRNRSNHSMREP